MPKFNVSITGVDVALEDNHATMERLEAFGMKILKEAYELERQTLAQIAKGNYPAVGFHQDKDTSRPTRPEGLSTLNPEIRHGH